MCMYVCVYIYIYIHIKEHTNRKPATSLSGINGNR